MKNFLSVLTFFLIFYLSAGEDTVHPASWKMNGNVSKLFDTPIGAVYKIDPGELCSAPIGKPMSPRILPRMGGLLQVSLHKDNEPTRRIVVIEFLARAFPAYSKKDTPRFRFYLARSAKSEMETNYNDLNGQLVVQSNGFIFLFSPYKPRYTLFGTYHDNPRLTPDFEPVALRIIFDTHTESVLGCFNGWKTLITYPFAVKDWPGESRTISESTVLNAKNYPNRTPFPVRSLGILTQIEKNGPRNQYLELSPPTIREFDDLQEALKLEPLLFKPYPYEQYKITPQKKITSVEQLIRQAGRERNPEVKYATALKLLYGKEEECFPAEAVRLLADAAKERHVLAMYQLGVCHYRGYGMAPDPLRALRYLEDAFDFGYQNAVALSWFIQWDQARRPMFNSSEFIEKLDKIKDKGPYQHDLDFIHRLVRWLPIRSIPYSMKETLLPENAHFRSWVNRTPNAQPHYYIDYAITSGYYQACAAKARWHDLDPSEKLELLKAGVAAGDTEAIPELLLAMAREGKLTTKEFTDERDLRFAENPLYQFLAYAVKHPDVPGVAEYLAGNNKLAYELFLSDSNYFPYGLALLTTLTLRTDMLNSSRGAKARAADAFSYLNKAAQQDNNPVAQYLLAWQYYRKDLPRGKAMEGFNPHKMLEAAMNSGHPKAALLLAEQSLAGNNFQMASNYLKKSGRTDYGSAFYLFGQMLHRFARQPQQTKAASLKAVELGEYRALQLLALHYADSPAEKRKFWHKFIQADLKYRTSDRQDPYYPRLYQDIYQWKSEENPNSRVNTRPDNSFQQELNELLRRR